MADKPDTPKAAEPVKSYRVLVGLDYLGHRAEPGDVIDDLPKASISWLLRDNHIEEVKE